MSANRQATSYSPPKEPCKDFPARAIRTVGGDDWKRGEITAHVHEHVVYAETVRLAAGILTQFKINSGRGTLATFSPHSLVSSSSSSSHAPPRALRENLEK